MKSNEALEEKPKYYYIVDADYSVAGHYWNDDIKAYTDEGDTYGSDGVETSKLYTWEELLHALDDEYLLTDDVPDEPPTEILKEEEPILRSEIIAEIPYKTGVLESSVPFLLKTASCPYLSMLKQDSYDYK